MLEAKLLKEPKNQPFQMKIPTTATQNYVKNRLRCLRGPNTSWAGLDDTAGKSWSIASMPCPTWKS